VFFLLLALAVVVGLAMHAKLDRPADEPTVFRSTWCPPAEMRTMPGPTLTKEQVLYRLRRAREKALALAESLETVSLWDEGGDDEAPARADGLARDIAGDLFELIADLDLATTLPMEPS